MREILVSLGAVSYFCIAGYCLVGYIAARPHHLIGMIASVIMAWGICAGMQFLEN
jgi:hypothetical protein